MKVSGPTGVSRPQDVRRTEKASGAADAASAAPSRPIADTVAVAGIPAEEMTPKVRDAIMNLMAEVDTLRRELERTKHRLAEMERLADMDTLTPIANRRAFVRELTRMIAFAERYGAPSSLAYFDVNDLKHINDKYGHAAGDKALTHVAQTLLQNVRSSDIVGRLGGDEFGVILAQIGDENAAKKAQQLAETVQATPFEWEGQTIDIRLASGFYTFDGKEDATKALAFADERMYAAKRASKSGR